MRPAAWALMGAVALAGCAEDPAGHGTGARADPDGAQPRLAPARCPASLSNCSVATGRIVYVEKVDPDGDGDAHFVIAGRPGVTGPGLSAVDVKRSLRPRPLPGIGDRLSAAGPVYRGSHGQRQIEAVQVRVPG